MKKIFCLVICVLMLTGCKNINSKKVDYTDSDKIYIGVAYPIQQRGEDVYLTEGIEFAIETINKDGGVLGKELDIFIKDDRNDANLAMQQSQTFCDEGITAVIGHWSTNVTYYAEDIYEKNKVVMITPRASGMKIFDSDFEYIFRMCGNNEMYAESIGSYLKENGISKVSILYSDDEYGVDFAAVIENELNNLGIIVVDRVTDISPVNAESILNRWNAFDSEGVITAMSYPQYISPIRLIRENDCNLPVFGADNFDYIAVSELSEEGIDGLYKVFFRDEDLEAQFCENFRLKYGHGPDLAAIIGYESVFILRDAMEAVNSTDGTKIANYLSSLNNYKTVTGVRSYNADTGEFDGFNVNVIKLG